VANKFNGTQVTRAGNTIFVPLPRESWTSAGICRCAICDGREGFWDTLAIAANPAKGVANTTWTVHYPELQATESNRPGWNDRPIAGSGDPNSRDGREASRI
jgi:hypothetical protein